MYYEPREECPTLPFQSPRVWPPVLDLDDDFIVRLRNQVATKGSGYYNLLLTDRPVKFVWSLRPPEGDGRVQIDGLDPYPRGEPAYVWVCIDASEIKDQSQLETYLRVAREAYRQDGVRWVNEKWPEKKPWEEE